MVFPWSLPGLLPCSGPDSMQDPATTFPCPACHPLSNQGVPVDLGCIRCSTQTHTAATIGSGQKWQFNEIQTFWENVSISPTVSTGNYGNISIPYSQNVSF